MQSGDKVVNLAVATSERWSDRQSGERREKTEWHRVVIFDQNIADVAEMIIACASTRRESRGLHYTIDYPEPREDYAKDTLIVHGEPPHLSGR